MSVFRLGGGRTLSSTVVSVFRLGGGSTLSSNVGGLISSLGGDDSLFDTILASVESFVSCLLNTLDSISREAGVV